MISALVLVCFSIPRLGHATKTNCMKLQTTFRLFRLFFLKKWSGTNFSTTYCAWKKMLTILHSISWANVIVWWPFFLEVSGNMCIIIVCCPVCDVINFEIYLSFFTKPFSLLTQNSEQKLKYTKNKKSFKSL